MMTRITKVRRDDGQPVDIIVFEESCKACGLCIDLCPTKVFDEATDHRMPVVARIEDCTACSICEFLCPDWAISVERRVRSDV